MATVSTEITHRDGRSWLKSAALAS